MATRKLLLVFLSASVQLSLGDEPAPLEYDWNQDGLGLDWSPDAERIAFTSIRESNWDVFIVNRDGTGLRNLTPRSAHDIFPSWSQDGKKVAFMSDAGGEWDIHVVDVETGAVSTLFDEPAGRSWVAWSPTDSRLAFVSSQEGEHDIFILGEDGTTIQVTDDEASEDDVVWSPDGRTLAFVSNRTGEEASDDPRGQYHIYTVSLADLEVKRLTFGNTSRNQVISLTYSADGSEIGFVSEPDGVWGVHAVNVNDGTIRRITATPQLPGESGMSPMSWCDWAPDGSAIAFTLRGRI